MVPFRVGQGYDVHRFESGRELWLGGVKIEYPLGLKGHSDADVLLHAISDALLGALALRDIGYHFPDNDPKYKGADSKQLLKEVARLVLQKGYKVGNIDATIVAEQPKINPYVPAMQEVIAQLLSVDVDQVSIKATTNEQMGFTGRQEGILALATALVYRD
ncbi:2-C-methyl-D-erythritol 2,4-cyclodiphosphate synthase [Porphyromonas somerae]|uniref:2-C-methyl-D-erythritol 2,4-cyclodiphosphate synthase n=1 Tax=Porphyromonas somerae TaxID=322095 RepID=UPI00033EDE98|nr:2-C-methyl-D-erythritol 2,4-cyclodiphosphate synthase [Porphyromonas somerae]BDE82407.1 2-C-methyl-D-erythritol 2,4-cyclodiphosphate synthase [Porphyromonas somerae]CCY10392.1 2-C-methyl-D-erythritol 2 4-cyclodiphosphate synthase [Porphyromonas sp. CAG:1061]